MNNIKTRSLFLNVGLLWMLSQRAIGCDIILEKSDEIESARSCMFVSQEAGRSFECYKNSGESNGSKAELRACIWE